MIERKIKALRYNYSPILKFFGTTNHIIPMLSSDNLTKFRYFSSALSAPTYQIHTLFLNLSVNMYYLQPILLCKSNMAKRNFCRLINVFRERSELWVYMETVDIALCVLIKPRNRLEVLRFCVPVGAFAVKKMKRAVVRLPVVYKIEL